MSKDKIYVEIYGKLNIPDEMVKTGISLFVMLQNNNPDTLISDLTISTQYDDGIRIKRKLNFMMDENDILHGENSETIQKTGIEPPRQKSKQHNHKDLDIGKIKALRKAGWSLADIGDEMKVSATTIANKLKQDQEEVKE